jgi:hypothetical protein
MWGGATDPSYAQRRPSAWPSLNQGLANSVSADALVLAALDDVLTQTQQHLSAQGLGGMQSVLGLEALSRLLPQLSPADKLLMALSLLRLPANFSAGLSTLLPPTEIAEGLPHAPQVAQDSPIDPDTLATALAQTDSPVALDQLQVALQQRLAQGQQRLGKLLAGSGVATMASQAPVLSDLLTQLQGLTAQLQQATPQQSLTPLLLLYLPYLPIGVLPLPLPWPEWPDDDGMADGGAEGGESPPLSIYLETVKLGKLKAQLQVSQHTQLRLSVTHQPLASVYLPEWETALGSLWQQKGLPPPQWEWTQYDGPAHTQRLDAIATKAVGLPQQAPTLPSRKLAVQPPPNVLPVLLHGAYQWASVVFKTDQQLEKLYKP